jgi:hypothetical protein
VGGGRGEGKGMGLMDVYGVGGPTSTAFPPPNLRPTPHLPSHVTPPPPHTHTYLPNPIHPPPPHTHIHTGVLRAAVLCHPGSAGPARHLQEGVWRRHHPQPRQGRHARRQGAGGGTRRVSVGGGWGWGVGPGCVCMLVGEVAGGGGGRGPCGGRWGGRRGCPGFEWG